MVHTKVGKRKLDPSISGIKIRSIGPPGRHEIYVSRSFCSRQNCLQISSCATRDLSGTLDFFLEEWGAQAEHSISWNTGPTGMVDGQKPAPDGRTKHISMRETVTISTDARSSPSNRIKSMTAINGAEEKNMLQHCGVVMFDGEWLFNQSKDVQMKEITRILFLPCSHHKGNRKCFFSHLLPFICSDSDIFYLMVPCSSFQLGRCMLTHPVQWPHWIDWSLKKMQRTPKDLKKKERIVFHSSMSKLCRLQ